MFDLPPRTGLTDCVEFLLSIGLHHSPLGWPSLKVLQDVRAALENEVPAGSTWPDFYITEDVLVNLQLFSDPNKAEEGLANKFPWQTSKKPALFDRCGEQMRWLIEVFRNFQAPLRQLQAYELEVNWWEHQMRVKDEDKVCTKLLDDVPASGNSTPTAQITPTAGVEGGSMTHSPAGTSEDAAPQPPPGPPPRPRTPRDVPDPPERGISVRQLLAYLCMGTSLEDGLTRAVTILGPPGSTATTPVPLVELHAALLQLGARATVPSLEGNGRPRLPSLQDFCQELGIDSSSPEAVMSVKDFLTHQQAKKICSRLALGRLHSRVQVEKLFPRNLEPGAKITASQRFNPP
jgi:hypothetical protein